MSKIKLGLSNTFGKNVAIVYSTVIGRNNLGKVSDIFTAWAEKDRKINIQHSSPFRILVQSMLEFVFYSNPSGNGNVECIIHEGQIVVAVRCPIVMNLIEGSFEKTLSQYWMKSEESSLMRKVLLPHDRVEVRVNKQVGIMEWRVCRPISGEQNLDQPSFLVFSDDSKAIDSEHEKYVDLGDLPHQEWLKDVYRSKGTKSASGEIFSGKDSLQEGEEWARTVAEKQAADIDREARFHADPIEKLDSNSVTFSLTDEEEDSINEKSAQYFQDLNKQLLSEKADAQEKAKEKIKDCKKNELRAIREAAILGNKCIKLEDLLKKKESADQRQKREITQLREQVNKATAEKEKKMSGNDVAFRDKALQMFEQLKKVKDESKGLAVKIEELKAELATHTLTAAEAKEITSLENTTEDLTKRVERLNRALETEKGKVKSLSERLMVAEKEVQRAVPLATDLENKMEQAHRLSAQQKKEIETVKQKLVQSEAEKNKINNELVKAQAQIQSLSRKNAA